MALPNIFATTPAGNVPASELDTNFTFLEAQGIQSVKTTGSSSAYIATPADAWVTGYSQYAGRALLLIPNFTNVGSCSLNVSGLGPVDIYKKEGITTSELLGGEIVSGIPIMVICDGTNFVLYGESQANFLI
jgi:hypothetical protein